MIAWGVGGEFYVTWAHVGLWGGLVAGAWPWICEMIYIFSEWPIRESGSAWPFIFWSAEFFMLFMQGLFWLASFILHLLAVPILER